MDIFVVYANESTRIGQLCATYVHMCMRRKEMKLSILLGFFIGVINRKLVSAKINLRPLGMLEININQKYM